MAGRRMLIVGAAVAAAVAAGIVLIGSPGERARRTDGRRIEDLRRISEASRLFHRRHSRLPPSLAAVAGEPGVAIEVADPVSGEPYSYRMVASDRYELCAVFDRESADDEGVGFWSHRAGQQCFTLGASEIR